MPQTRKQQKRRKAKNQAKRKGYTPPFTAKRQNGATAPAGFGH